MFQVLRLRILTDLSVPSNLVFIVVHSYHDLIDWDGHEGERRQQEQYTEHHIVH